jgi:hypothetical protein
VSVCRAKINIAYQGYCNVKCFLFEVVLKTVHLYSLLCFSRDTTRDRPVRYLHSLEEIVNSTHQTEQSRKSDKVCNKHASLRATTEYLIAVGMALDGKRGASLAYLDKCLNTKKDFSPAIFLKGIFAFSSLLFSFFSLLSLLSHRLSHL